VRTNDYVQQFPGQIVNQAFTLPHEVTLRETKDGLRVFFTPAKELEALRGEELAEGVNLTPAQANELLRNSAGELSETCIEFAESAPRQLLINGMDAGFTGRSARIFTDRTFNEIYADDGISYELRNAPPERFPSRETKLTATDGTVVSSLKIYRMKSIWNER
jgi:hypothetical protein